MSDTMASLNRQIKSANELQSVVRTMKALAASSLVQYERSVSALGDYYRTVELGLCASLLKVDAHRPTIEGRPNSSSVKIGAVVFGSDQGLVGRFNDEVADFAIEQLTALTSHPRVWAVGERIHVRLSDAGLEPIGLFAVPNSVAAITPLVGKIQIQSETHRARGDYTELYVFHNRPKTGALYYPVSHRLLPLDQQWQDKLVKIPWPTKTLPEVMGGSTSTLRALIREYLFISLFRACAESLASENASRLASMQRADHNIGELLEQLQGSFHRMRQSNIDEELFDVISGYEALNKSKAP